MSIQKHKINDKTDIGNPQCFCPSELPHTYMHTHIPSSISQYIAVVVSTAGNIWRHFKSVYISKTLKNTAGARRVIRNQVTKKDCLNSNNSRLCLSRSPSGTCFLSLHSFFINRTPLAFQRKIRRRNSAPAITGKMD